MRVLVLGGSWFVGRTVVRNAVERGLDVTGFNRGLSGSAPEGVRHLTGNREDGDHVRRLVQGGPWAVIIDVAGWRPGVGGGARLGGGGLVRGAGVQWVGSAVLCVAG